MAGKEKVHRRGALKKPYALCVYDECQLQAVCLLYAEATDYLTTDRVHKSPQ